ncbi:MAG: hypothetical protein J5628_07515 [Lachnospiraceae bacterium]|nr:hypothetical protein [Lachnospiraceae bacterium]MBO4788933.1 hypothetical protein [Lachnospiraceae bacterium]
MRGGVRHRKAGKMINKLERKFGRYAIRGLMKYMMVLYGVGFLIFALSPDFYWEWLSLDVEKTFLHGQVWRLFTFLVQPIENSNLFFVLISMYLYYFLGNMLEARWGSFRFNLFYFSGILFNILMCIAFYLVFYFVYGVGYSVPVGLEYINLAMFFAFATEFGDVQLLVFFLIPIKVKYLGMAYAGYYIYVLVKLFIQCTQSGAGLLVFWLAAIPFVVGILNFLIYFVASRKTRKIRRRTIADLRRRYAYMQGVAAGEREGSVVNTAGARKVITKHRCAVCGRTELDDDMLEFRFCSKCEGNYEYCMDHLYTHTHVKREPVGGSGVGNTNNAGDKSDL